MTLGTERLLLEQLHYNLLFRWFVGLSPDDPIWHPTTFTKNRERLLNEEVMGRFLEKLMGAPEVKPLLSDEHFSVDGTLLQAWASHASLERIDGKDDPPPPPSGPGEGFGAPKPGRKRAKGDFRGIKLSNETHRSGTDPDALLCRMSSDSRFWSSGDTKTGPPDGLLMGAFRRPLDRCFIGGCRVVCVGCGIDAAYWVVPPQASSTGGGGRRPSPPVEEEPPACGRSRPLRRFSLSR